MSNRCGVLVADKQQVVVRLKLKRKNKKKKRRGERKERGEVRDGWKASLTGRRIPGIRAGDQVPARLRVKRFRTQAQAKQSITGAIGGRGLSQWGGEIDLVDKGRERWVDQ